MDTKDKPTGQFDDWPVIHQYTRADALADGTLIDLTKLAQEAGIMFPTAISAAAYALAIEPPTDSPEQCTEGRTWDVLNVFRFAAQRAGRVAEVRFTVRVRRNAHTCCDVQLKSLVHPGDTGEPVISIMLPDED